MILKSMLIWLSITPLAILNGGFRNHVLTPWLGEGISRPISGIILSACIFFVSFIFIPRLGKGTRKTYIIMGLLWVFATLIFETIMGFVEGESFEKILSAYDVTTGNLWSFIVIFMGIIPILIANIRRLIKTQ